MPFHPNARLPLIQEYDGLCHAGSEPGAIAASSRFAGCNHGNRDDVCNKFPAGQDQMVLRFTILREDDDSLEILTVEETNHRPSRWNPVRFTVTGEQLTPDLSDRCLRAQLLAFCRSYLREKPLRAS